MKNKTLLKNVFFQFILKFFYRKWKKSFWGSEDEEIRDRKTPGGGA